MKPGFWYLASPYSHQSAYVRHDRALMAREATYQALQQGFVTFSPIHATHDLAVLHSMPKDAAWWESYNDRFLAPAEGVIVLMLDGWQQSVGVRAEIDYALRAKKPGRILYMCPRTWVITEDAP